MAEKETILTEVPVEDGKKNSMKKYTVSLDTTEEDVIKYDKSGAVLFFESEPGKFKKLPESVLTELSRKSLLSYIEAERSNKREGEKQAKAPTPGFTVGGNLATAMDRLKIEQTPESKAKWHVVWKRPDEAPYLLTQGYSYVTENDGVKTYSSILSGPGHYVVGAGGREELVLLKCSVELFKEILRRNSELSFEQNEGVKAEASDKIESLHPDAKTFDPSTRKDLKF